MNPLNLKYKNFKKKLNNWKLINKNLKIKK